MDVTITQAQADAQYAFDLSVAEAVRPPASNECRRSQNERESWTALWISRGQNSVPLDARRWLDARRGEKSWHELDVSSSPVTLPLEPELASSTCVPQVVQCEDAVPEGATCFICCDDGDLVRGCACRGHNGWVHVAARAEKASSRDV